MTIPQQVRVCPNPVFIIGSPRSGTTALAWSLAQHSQLWTSAESDILFHLFGNQHAEIAFHKAKDPPGLRWLKTEKVEKKEFFAFLGLGPNALFTSRSQGKRWIDQTPLYTLIADELADLFPGAFFIHILRDGRRVVKSMSAFLKSEGVRSLGIKSDFIGSWSTDFREACRAWRLYVEKAMTFAVNHPTRSLTVMNEQLLEKPEEGFKNLLEFIGSPYEDGPAIYFKTHRINSSFEKNSVGPLSGQQFPNPWKSWSLEQKVIFRDEAGPTLLKYGLATEDELWLPKENTYEEMLAQIRRAVTLTLPSECTVAVVSKGDVELLRLDGRKTLHLPQTEDGNYAGCHPEDSDEAIRHLEALRQKGADYLLLPGTSSWWLDYYEEFRIYLNSRHNLVWQGDECVIYRLNGCGGGTPSGEPQRPPEG